jgi:hypothetical protein
MVSEDASLYSQHPAIDPYSEPAKSNQYPHKYLFTVYFTLTTIVSDYRLDDWGSIPVRAKGFFLKPGCPKVHPASYPHGYWRSFSRG